MTEDELVAALVRALHEEANRKELEILYPQAHPMAVPLESVSRALLAAARLIRKNEWILAEAGDDRWICGACDGAVYSGDGDPREDWYEHHDHDCAIGMWVRAAGRAGL